LERLNQRIATAGDGHLNSDAELIEKINEGMPEEYKSVKNQVRIDVTERQLTLAQVKDRYYHYWEHRFKEKNKDSDSESDDSDSDDDELAKKKKKKKGGAAYNIGTHKSNQKMYGKNSWKNFKGNCNHCGQQGHKKISCPELQGTGNHKSQSDKNGKGPKCFNQPLQWVRTHCKKL
jgi:hypothetical protein